MDEISCFLTSASTTVYDAVRTATIVIFVSIENRFRSVKRLRPEKHVRPSVSQIRSEFSYDVGRSVVVDTTITSILFGGGGGGGTGGAKGDICILYYYYY